MTAQGMAEHGASQIVEIGTPNTQAQACRWAMFACQCWINSAPRAIHFES